MNHLQELKLFKPQNPLALKRIEKNLRRIALSLKGTNSKKFYRTFLGKDRSIIYVEMHVVENTPVDSTRVYVRNDLISISVPLEVFSNWITAQPD